MFKKIAQHYHYQSSIISVGIRLCYANFSLQPQKFVLWEIVVAEGWLYPTPSYKYTINWSSEWTTHVKYELGKWLQNGVLIVTENTPHMNFGPHWTKITKYLPDGRKHLGHHPMVSQNPNLWQHWTIYIFLFEILLKNNNRVKNEYLFKYKLTTN